MNSFMYTINSCSNFAEIQHEQFLYNRILWTLTTLLSIKSQFTHRYDINGLFLVSHDRLTNSIVIWYYLLVLCWNNNCSRFTFIYFRNTFHKPAENKNNKLQVASSGILNVKPWTTRFPTLFMLVQIPPMWKFFHTIYCQKFPSLVRLQFLVQEANVIQELSWYVYDLSPNQTSHSWILIFVSYFNQMKTLVQISFCLLLLPSTRVKYLKWNQKFLTHFAIKIL
jgi:hypothetical protein